MKKGFLFGRFETGCEGVEFSLQDEKFIENDQWNYAGLNIINPGDHLTIYDNKNPEIKIFDGILEGEWTPNDWNKYFPPKLIIKEKDFFAGYIKHPMNPKLGQLCLNGLWVHWLPTNIDLKLWFDIFYTNSGKYIGVLNE